MRRFINVECRSGAAGNGPTLDAAARALLGATYLRPLRDADQALSAGRGSRLAQIFQQTDEVATTGVDFDPETPPDDPAALSVLGIGDFANNLLERQEGINGARTRLNENYLAKLSFEDDTLKGGISSAEHGAAKRPGSGSCSKSWSSTCVTTEYPIHRLAAVWDRIIFSSWRRSRRF